MLKVVSMNSLESIDASLGIVLEGYSLSAWNICSTFSSKCIKVAFVLAYWNSMSTHVL